MGLVESAYFDAPETDRVHERLKDEVPVFRAVTTISKGSETESVSRVVSKIESTLETQGICFGILDSRGT